MSTPETEIVMAEANTWPLAQLRSLSVVLCFPAAPIHEVYVKAYGPRVKKEAAVYAAAILESVCAEILRAAVSVAQSNSFKSKRRKKATEIIPCYIQLALRRDTNLRVLCSTCTSIASVLESFLDNDTLTVMKETDKLNELDVADMDQGRAGTEKDILRAAKRAETWCRQKDDIVTDVELSDLLRKVHPVYALSNDARLFLAALVRTLLLEMTKIASINSDSVLLDMKMMETIVNHIMPGKIGSQGRRTAKEAVDRFYLRTFDGSITRISVRVQDGPEVISKANFKIKSETRIEDMIARACEKLRVNRKKVVFVYGGKLIKEKATPKSLGMSTKNIVDVFALPKTWWQFKQREAARRGLLTSAKSHDLSQLKAASSRVDNQAKGELLRKMKGSTSNRNLHSMKNSSKYTKASISSTSLDALASLKVPILPSPAEKIALKTGHKRSLIKVNKDVFKSRLKQPSKVSKSIPAPSTTTRIIKTPEDGERPDMDKVSALPLLPYKDLYSEKNLEHRKQMMKQHGNVKRRKKVPRHNKSKIFKEKQAVEFRELVKVREKARKHEAALRIQAKFRGVKDRQKAMAAREARKQHVLNMAREKRRRSFLSSATALLRDAEQAARTWTKLASSIRKTRDWVCHEKSYQRVLEDEEQECFKLSRQLRSHLQNATDGTRRLQLNLEDPLFEMLEHWEKYLEEDNTLLTGSENVSTSSPKNSSARLQKKKRPMLKDFQSTTGKGGYGTNYRNSLSPVNEESTTTQEQIFTF